MGESHIERRLAAILVADVVGFSRLMQADEAGTMAALKSRRTNVIEPLVDEHRGNIFKVMGDGILVEFGSAVNAVKCAVALQAAMLQANNGVPEDDRIVLRIGVNLGDVVVEGTDLYGDGVNIAARLQSIAPAGAICISGKVHSEVHRKLAVRFEDLGERLLKNIAEPLHVFRVSDDNMPAPRARRAPEDAGRPSIAILPFLNMSGDPGQEFFSDGITEDIITQLSRFRNLLVIARNSSFAYKGRSVNVGIIAQELGVRYVVEGSVRRSGQHVRITAQLIDAESGKHLWAERYDRELTDIFAVQDEVSFSIVGTLAVELEGDSLERARQKQPENLQAYEYWLRGKRIWTAGLNNLEARRHFERAAQVDPGFARAYSGLARTYIMEALEFPLPEDLRAAHASALKCAQRALALDESDYRAHVELTWFYLHHGDFERAKKHIERAIQLNPNDADTLADAAYLLAALGRPQDGIVSGRSALRLNPHHPDWYLGFLSDALFAARRYAEALDARVRAPDAFIDSSFFGAAIFAHLGRIDEARRWASTGIERLSTTPGGAVTVKEGRVIQRLLENNPYLRPEDRDHFANGLRRAAVPE